MKVISYWISLNGKYFLYFFLVISLAKNIYESDGQIPRFGSTYESRLGFNIPWLIIIYTSWNPFPPNFERKKFPHLDNLLFVSITYKNKIKVWNRLVYYIHCSRCSKYRLASKWVENIWTLYASNGKREFWFFELINTEVEIFVR